MNDMELDVGGRKRVRRLKMVCHGITCPDYGERVQPYDFSRDWSLRLLYLNLQIESEKVSIHWNPLKELKRLEGHGKTFYPY